MKHFNVPNLFYLLAADDLYHISRTNIAGCTTECGIPLQTGAALTRRRPEIGLCRTCVYEIENMTPVRVQHG
jgi:hypothetical protein